MSMRVAVIIAMYIQDSKVTDLALVLRGTVDGVGLRRAGRGVALRGVALRTRLLRMSLTALLR